MMKRKRIFRSFCRASEDGSALALVLTLTAVGMISVMSLIQFAKPLLTSYLNTAQLAAYRTTMDGILDYTIGGVKQNKCFNNLLLWADNCDDIKDLSDPYNPQRLLLSMDSLDQIILSQVSGAGALPTKLPDVADPKDINWRMAIPLKQMEFEFDILGGSSPITPAHPLFTLLDNVKFKKPDGSGNLVIDDVFAIEKVKVTIKRVTNPYKIQNDYFSVLEFKVELVPKSSSFFLGSLNLSATSEVLFSPRTLATHALILAGNLNLDKANPHTLALPIPRESYIPIFATKADSGAGLRFESSVFVNGNVVLPPEGSPTYVPVSFHDKLILGGGHLKRGAGFFRPKEPGSFRHRLLSQLEDIGGFTRGVELDPEVDLGLDDLFFDNPATLSSEALNLCLARSRAMIEKAVTRESRLYMAYNGSVDVGTERYFDFSMSLGKINYFLPQSDLANPTIPLGPVAHPDGIAQSSDVTYLVPDINNMGERPVARVTVKMTNLNDPISAIWNPNVRGTNEFYAFGNLSKNGQMTIRFPDPSGASPAIIVKLDPSVIGGRSQSTEAKARVSFVNEGRLRDFLIDRGTMTCTAPPPGAPVNPFVYGVTAPSYTASCAPGEFGFNEVIPPKVVVDIEAFDVAYVGGETRRLYVGVDRETSAAHPLFGSRKSQQLVFTRALGQSQWSLSLGSRTATADPFDRNWAECMSRDQLGSSPTNCQYPADASAPMFKSTPYYPAAEIYHIPHSAPFDLESFYDLCGTRPAVKGAHNPAFGALDYYYSVSKDQSLSAVERKRRVRNAWGFVPGYSGSTAPTYSQEKVDDPSTPVNEAVPGYIDMLILNETAAKADALEVPLFGVQSRVGECRVQAGANFVTGLFVCNRFIIEPRNSPLRIVGTVITGSLEIHPSAVKMGIRWSSVFNTSAMFELQRAGVLNYLDDCMNPNLPHWMPVKTSAEEDFLRSCLPVSLVKDIDPFNWTLVDPDCVQSPNNEARMACKKSPRRFITREITRRYWP